MKNPTASRVACAVAGIMMLTALIAPGVSRAADPAPPTPTDTLLTNGSWSNPAIWSHGVPTSSDDVDLNGAHATVDGPVSVHSLNMDGGALFGSVAGATLTIGAGGAVTGGLWAPDAGGGTYVSDLDLPTTVDGPAYIHTLSVIPPQVNALPSSTDTASLDLGGASAIEPTTALGAGGFELSPGTTLTNHGILVATASLGGGGSVVNAAGATMTAQSPYPFTQSGSGFGISPPIDNYGTLGISGAVRVSGGAASHVTITGHSGIIDIASGADVQEDSGQAASALPVIVLQGGELAGTGRVDGGVENDGGTVSPGGDGQIGTLRIVDQQLGYVQKSGGTLRVDVRGTQPGTTLDQLQVGGPVTLGGNLYIDSSGYAPAAGVDHEIVQSINDTSYPPNGGGLAAPPTGTFAQLTGPGASLFRALYAPSSAPDSVILRLTGPGGGTGGTGHVPPAGGTGQVPTVVGATQSHRTWREGTKLAVFARASAPVGDTFEFSLNEPARVTLYFDRFVPGRRLRAKCVAPTRKNHGKPPCKRTLAVGAISFTGHSGLNKAMFDGRLSKSRKLALGRYRLRIVAVAGGKSSTTSTLTFTIVK